METLLRLDASPRAEGSHSRALADHLQALWEHAPPGGMVLRRDRAAEQIPHLHAPALASGSEPGAELEAELAEQRAAAEAFAAALQRGDHVSLELSLARCADARGWRRRGGGDNAVARRRVDRAEELEHLGVGARARSYARGTRAARSTSPNCRSAICIIARSASLAASRALAGRQSVAPSPPKT